MTKTKQDLRVRKTQQALSTAMFVLLDQQPFAKITVNDLCTEALVSRSTFYDHFEDKYALLRFCMELLKKRLFQNSEHMSFQERIHYVLEQIQREAKTFRNLMAAEFDLDLLKMMRASFLCNMQDLFENNKEELPPLPGPAEIVCVYYSSAITSTIMYWIEKKMPYSIEEMASCLYSLLPPQITCKEKECSASV